MTRTQQIYAEVIAYLKETDPEGWEHLVKIAIERLRNRGVRVGHNPTSSTISLD